MCTQPFGLDICNVKFRYICTGVSGGIKLESEECSSKNWMHKEISLLLNADLVIRREL